MKCPYCSTWSQVKETRGVRRRRICANQHLFTTIETLAGRKPKGPGATALSDRDKQIVAQVIEGRAPANVAASFNLSHNRVNRIVKRLAPDYDARSAGQARAWVKRKQT